MARRLRSFYAGLSFRPPEPVAAAARRALERRAQQPPSNCVMTPVGLARAHELLHRQELSPQTIDRMVGFFARHVVDMQGSSWEAYGKGQACNGVISTGASASCSTCGVLAPSVPPWVEEEDPALMAVTSFNLQNLRGQSLLFRCQDTGFVTTAPALTRYQQGRGIHPSRRELVGERPAHWCRSRPVTICEHCGLAIKGNQWTLRQHQESKRCRKTRTPLPL